MSDDSLTVTSGTISVSTDELYQGAILLSSVVATTDSGASDVASARGCLSGTGEAQFDFAAPYLERADAALTAATNDASELGSTMLLAADIYSGAEKGSEAAFQLLNSLAGATVGFWLSRLLLPLAWAAAIAALPMLPFLAALAANPQTRGMLSDALSSLGEGVGDWLKDASDNFNNPAVVQLVRNFVDSSDDLLKGIAGMAPVASLFVPTSSATTAKVLSNGVPALAETPVTTKPVSTVPVAPPKTIAEMADRIPPSEPGEPQVRIEKYVNANGEVEWIVYVSGTIDMNVADGTEPFDMESNVSLMADQSGAGLRAVLQAMEDAGIPPNESVTITGHSQGGVVAAMVAASGLYSVDTVVTFGAPASQVEIPAGTDVYSVEHNEDMVPALSGNAPADDDRTVISRNALDDPSSADPFAAHNLTEYEKTAAMMDESNDARLKDLQNSIAGIGDGAESGSSTAYKAERVDEKDAGEQEHSPSTAKPGDADKPEPEPDPGFDGDVYEPVEADDPPPVGTEPPDDGDLSWNDADKG